MYCADTLEMTRQPTKISHILPMQGSFEGFEDRRPLKANINMSALTELKKEDTSHIAEKTISRLAETFATALPEATFSPAEIQGFLLGRKKDASKAVKDVCAWRDEVLQKKSVPVAEIGGEDSIKDLKTLTAGEVTCSSQKSLSAENGKANDEKKENYDHSARNGTNTDGGTEKDRTTVQMRQTVLNEVNIETSPAATNYKTDKPLSSRKFGCENQLATEQEQNKAKTNDPASPDDNDSDLDGNDDNDNDDDDDDDGEVNNSNDSDSDSSNNSNTSNTRRTTHVHWFSRRQGRRS